MDISIKTLVIGATHVEMERDDVFRALDDLTTEYAARVPAAIADVKLTVIHQGRASHPDGAAEEWAEARAMSVWELRLPRLGSLKDRNRLILDEGKPDVVLAFPGGRDVLDLIVQARQRKIRVVLVEGRRTRLKAPNRVTS